MLLIFVVIIVTVTWLYTRWCKVKSYWSERGVPHSPPSFLIGSLSFALKQNPNLWLRELYDKFKSPVVGVWFFWKPALIVNSPEIAKNILIRDSASFRDRSLSSGDSDPIGSLNLLIVKDPLWTFLRRRTSIIFTSTKLKAFQHNILMKSKELVQRIYNDRDKQVDIKSMYVDFTTDVIGCTALGVRTGATLRTRDPLRDVTGDIMTFGLHRALSWTSIFFFPDLVDIFRFKFFPKSTEDYLRKLFNKSITQRSAHVKHDDEAQDLIDLLMKLRREGAGGDESYTDNLIIAQAAILLHGGFETTAATLTFITYELAHCPEIQEKLYQELLSAKQKVGSSDFNLQLLINLPYLNCVIKEGLRKFSPIGWLDRIAANDYKINDNLSIKAGTPVFVNSTGIHYDPIYYPDPHKFDPERFSKEQEHKIKPNTYMPFGDGPRFCIGQRFGLMTLRFALSQVCLHYELRTRTGAPAPPDVTINKRGLLYTPGEPLSVHFVPRDTSLPSSFV